MIETARVTINLKELEKLADSLASKVPASVAVGLRQGVLLMVRETVKGKLSGQRLKRDTGNLQRSITTSPPLRPLISGSGESATVTDWFGTHLIYGRAHELGFQGAATVRAHSRRSKSGRVHDVRAHSRQMNIPAQHFIRDTLHELTGRTRLLVGQAILELIRTGRVPSATEVRGAIS